MSPAGNSGPIVIDNEVKVEGSGGTPARNNDLAKQMGRQLDATIRGVVASELHCQMRPGNMENRRTR
jgi:hypothetical protein